MLGDDLEVFSCEVSEISNESCGLPVEYLLRRVTSIGGEDAIGSDLTPYLEIN